MIAATMLPRSHHSLPPRLVAFACAAAGWLAPAAAQAAQPLPDLSDQATWTANGAVNSIATIGGAAYIGGNFSYRVMLTATDAAGNTSAAKVLAIRVVRR